jgi:hypothetical protein
VTSHCNSSELDYNNLTSKNYAPDKQEHLVGEETLKYVDFVMDFPHTDHIENLENNEKVEDKCQVS